MIKNYYKRIFRILVLIFVFTVIGIHVVHGQAASSSFTSFLGVPDIYGLVNQVLGWLANYLLMIMSLLLSMAAAALNTSIVITMHIREFVDSTPVIYEVWKIIRDISGIFFIFVLLIAAIKIILGLDTKISEVIKNIVIAGVLINFSFFIVSVLIDASNIVSQTIYNAMIPNSPAVTMSDFGPAVSDGKGGSNGGIKALTQKYFSNTPSKGSITDIFMQSLSVQSLYNKQLMNNNQYKNIDNNSSSGIMTMIKIILIAVVGSIIMFTSAVSFMIAAGAFIVRLVILLFLLAFSPIYFAGMVIPGIKEYVGDFKNQLQSQLIFMPVYLLLMYVALRVLNESKILGTGYMQLYQGNLGNSWAIDLIALGVNFALVIVILNIPLIGAMKLGGSATKLFSNLASKYGASNVWKNVGNWSREKAIDSTKWTYDNTGRRVASRIARSGSFQKFAANNWIGEQALKSMRATGAGFDDRLKNRIAKREEFYNSLPPANKTDYARRISSTIPAKLSFAGVLGRADRVGSARILKTRRDEIKSNLDRLTNELNNINAAAQRAGGIANLPAYQIERNDLLTGSNISTKNPSNKNLITDEQNDLNTIEGEIRNFETRTGASIKDIDKRAY